MYNDYGYTPAIFRYIILATPEKEFFLDEFEAFDAFADYVRDNANPEMDYEEREDMINSLCDEWWTYELVSYKDAVLYTEWTDET